MKKFLLILCFFSAVTTLCAQKLKFTEVKHNFGYLQKGEVDTIPFDFVNDGNAELIFKPAKTDFNCFKVVILKDTVPAHGTGTVLVIFDTKRAPAHVDKAVTIISNSKKGEEILHIKGDIVAKKKLGF